MSESSRGGHSAGCFASGAFARVAGAALRCLRRCRAAVCVCVKIIAPTFTAQQRHAALHGHNYHRQGVELEHHSKQQAVRREWLTTIFPKYLAAVAGREGKKSE